MKNKKKSVDALPNIGVAIKNIEQISHQFPPLTDKRDAQGKLRASWMTGVLPYLDQAPAYNQMNFDTAWDDPSNHKIIKYTLPEFQQPDVNKLTDAREFGLAHYTGNSQFFRAEKQLTTSDVKDGLSNTVAAGVVNDGYRPWADPENVRDFANGIAGGAHAFGPAGQLGMIVLMADGSVRQLTPDISPDVLKAMANPTDGR